MPNSNTNDPDYVPSPKDIEEGLKPRGSQGVQEGTESEHRQVSSHGDSIWVIGPAVRRFRRVFRK